jgi:phosphoribosylanthranilate isomerase
MPTKVKICGITCLSDARAAVAAGADALGFNFYPGSPRCIDVIEARAIVRGLPPFVEATALFVNCPWTEVQRTAHEAGCGTVQVHGDALEPCPHEGLRWVAAFPARDAQSLGAVSAFIAGCPPRARPAAVLVDAHVPGQYGGTGQPAPWRLLAGFDPGVPVILAGGLRPENVAEAIRIVRPYAVDVASGVESSPGRKDADKLRRFIDAVRGADA